MAGIIKAGSTLNPVQSGSGSAFQFGDMENAYLEKVRAEANAIVAKARQEAAALQAQAAEQGKKAAMQAAELALRTKVDQQLQTLVPAMQQAVDAMRDARQSWLQHWEKQGLHLATAIAQRIIRREVAQKPEITLDLIREALELAAGSPRLTLRLNPADHVALGDRVTTLTSQLARLGETRVISDPTITPGGCRVESEFGTVDQQLETQLARITEELA
jgi:flagellar assembly protein FliH